MFQDRGAFYSSWNQTKFKGIFLAEMDLNLIKWQFDWKQN